MLRNGIVYTEIDRSVPGDVIRRLGELGVATVHEAMGKINLADPSVVLRCPGLRCAGPAVTCYTPAADNLMVHEMTRLARPGDVLVIEACGYEKGGLWGELLSLMAKRQGYAGVMINGAVRDIEQVRNAGVPLWSKSICSGGTDKNSVGAVNVPISFAGVLVSPGDIVIGDGDGIVVVPHQRAREILELAEERETKEDGYKQRIAAGELLYDIMNLDVAVNKIGLDIIQGKCGV